MSSLQVLRELILKSANKHCEITQKEYEGSCQISLAHVLIAYEIIKSYELWFCGRHRVTQECARIILGATVDWDLTKDLDEQSDSIIKTLLKLIKRRDLG